MLNSLWLSQMRLAFRQSQVRSSGPAHSFMEIGHEIISMAILFLPLNKVGQLSVTGEKGCANSTVYCLGSLPRSSMVRLTDGRPMCLRCLVTLKSIKTNKQTKSNDNCPT